MQKDQMLDDKDIFYSREATELLNEKLAPRVLSALFLLFNLLGARGVYYNLMNLNSWNDFTTVLVSFALWLLTLIILVFHNRVYKKLDGALNI